LKDKIKKIIILLYNKICTKIFVAVFFLFFLISSMISIYLLSLSKELPSINELNKFNPEKVTKILSNDDIVVKKLFIQKRDMIKIVSIPKQLRDALILMEDREFYSHPGINIQATFRALLVNILSLSTQQGASTITQQLARNMYNNKTAKHYIGSDKHIKRKIKEFITAIKIEQTYTKSEILELYFNSVYFGHGNYGVQSAATYYFGKDVSELDLDECAILIGLLPAPARYSPINHPERCIVRKNLVLSIMLNYGVISKNEYDIAKNKGMPIKDVNYDNSLAPYFSEYVRRQLISMQNELDVSIYEDGLNIRTTLDLGIQNILEKVFTDHMKSNQKIFNQDFLSDSKLVNQISKEYNISIDSLKTILNSDSLFIPKDLRKKLLVQGSAVVLDSQNGNILAMIGGRSEPEYLDFFNRAVQAKRQPGSVFKPFIYLTALENDYTPCKQLLNQPLVFFIDDTTRWNPQNHDGSTGLLTSLRDGLRRSLNLISVRIVQELVSPVQVKNTALRFGLSGPIRAVDAIALGVTEVYPIEITSAYSAIANNGILMSPLSIISISDNNNHEIKQFFNVAQEVATEDDIFLLRDMMKSVVDNGTGGSIRWKYKFYAPAAGKTGTTNSKTDAWFVGFTPKITIGVWVGMDDPSMVLGKKQYGSRAALPIFAKTIKEIYNRGYFNYLDQKINLNNKEDWEKSDGIISKEICKDKCCLKTDWCESQKEYFKINNIPNEECEEYSNPLFRFNNQ
tara:strand:+ start:334 stop:2553 length:2220 start_codon:yes stop_codon:yes gene_type:complete